MGHIEKLESLMAEPLPSTKSGATSIQTVSYTHDAIIDFILVNPKMKQGDIAKHFGYTEGWLSRVMGSDAFNARLAARKTEVVDPIIIQSMEEKLLGLAHQSLEVISAKLDATGSPDLAVKALQLSTQALGFGARAANIGQQNNTYVVALPQKATNEQEWASSAAADAKALAERARQAKEAAEAGVVDVQAKEV